MRGASARGDAVHITLTRKKHTDARRRHRQLHRQKRKSQNRFSWQYFDYRPLLNGVRGEVKQGKARGGLANAAGLFENVGRVNKLPERSQNTSE